MRIAYIFTTFPKLSEQFLLREVLELQRQGIEVEIYSILGSSDKSEAGPVKRMGFSDWVLLIVESVYWVGKRPKVVARALLRLLPFRYRSWTNYGENILGTAFALSFARRFRAANYRGMHATWATGPAMVAFLKDQLIGGGYTLEAHAYDIFRRGGDAFLLEKIQAADGVRVSTEGAKTELELRLRTAASGDGKTMPRIINVRHGLHSIADYCPPRISYPEQPIRAISVGRLVEKKGYFQQLKIYRHWLAQGVDFQATIAGGGPLFREIREAIRSQGLAAHVKLTGALKHSEVADLYRQSTVFLFTGLVSSCGDRDGFPNVIGEAMAYSLPVFSTDVAATTEGVIDGVTGRVIDLSDPEKTAMQILRDLSNHDWIDRTTQAAHQWIREEFDVQKNMRSLREAFWTCSDRL